MKLTHLQPKAVFHYFEEICAIPHGSGNMEKIRDYVVDFAKQRGLWVYTDKWCNVVIKKPATKGYEDHPAVILQGHLDMVCEKTPESTFDFERDGLNLGIDGDWIYAENTTLGGDDGIAVAMMLAILDAGDLAHPALEAVFTTDEETGMYGADGLDTSVLEGKLLINADSEEEGVLTVGCAGGARADITLPMTAATVAAPCYTITVDGLIGGHSGVEIHTGRQNANVLMGKFLCTLPADFQIVSIAGGQKDNAIPRSCTATVACEVNPADAVPAFIANTRIAADPDLAVTVTAVDAVESAFDAASSKRAAQFLATVPNGVQRYSEDIEGLVETSLNLGVLKSDGNTVSASFAVRSSVGKQKALLLERLEQTAKEFDGSFDSRGHYPAWEYRKQSRLRDTMVQVYRDQYGKDPAIVTIHAGLECGLFGDKIADLDAVSFGPDMQSIHTTEERLSISSTARTYAYLCQVLKSL